MVRRTPEGEQCPRTEALGDRRPDPQAPAIERVAFAVAMLGRGREGGPQRRPHVPDQRERPRRLPRIERGNVVGLPWREHPPYAQPVSGRLFVQFGQSIHRVVVSKALVQRRHIGRSRYIVAPCAFSCCRAKIDE